LAKLLGRDFKNVHTDVKLLADIGLLDLKETGNSRNGLIPLAKFSGIDLDWAA
jgi:predicted transcriptional regulator